MCQALDIQCIDLTRLTEDLNVRMGQHAQWMHAFTGAKYAADGVSLIPTGLDKTHTNSYGAKMNAWLIANADTSLKKYSRHKVQPTYNADFADAANPDYEVSSYAAPTGVSALWPAYTDASGRVWNGTVFGDVGGQDKITAENFTAQLGADGSITLGVANNRGKIAGSSDGIMMYYVQLPAGTTFKGRLCRLWPQERRAVQRPRRHPGLRRRGYPEAGDRGLCRRLHRHLWRQRPGLGWVRLPPDRRGFRLHLRWVLRLPQLQRDLP